MKAKLGDTVTYTGGFLRSICDYSHEIASRRGEVIELYKPMGGKFIRIQWQHETEPHLVLAVNICKVRSNGVIADPTV